MPDAANRRAFSEVQKVRLAPAEQRHQLLAAQARTLIKIRQRAAFGKLAPRADQLAIVAAVDAVANPRAQIKRDRPGVLYRQVRNSATRVQQARRTT